MRGFVDKALVLLSSFDDYEECGSIYKYDYKVAIRNLVAYLHGVGIAHHCLVTDSLATCMDMQNPQWLATGAPEDMFFMQNYCGVPRYAVQALSPELIETLHSKFPIVRGLEPEERFKVVAKRVKFVEKELIASYRFVVVFGKTFNVKSRTGDGRAILRINDKRFYTSMELSGDVVPINEFLQIPYASQCLSEWGKHYGRG